MKNDNELIWESWVTEAKLGLYNVPNRDTIEQYKRNFELELSEEDLADLDNLLSLFDRRLGSEPIQASKVRRFLLRLKHKLKKSN